MDIDTRTALIVIDVQRGGLPDTPSAGIPHMDGGDERLARTEALVEHARDVDVPVIFIQEVHKPDGRDFGRELDGTEGPHCLEGAPETELAIEPRPEEYLIRKRRYSAFFATELDLVLRNLRIETVVLVGTLTDVCVHYTAADAHQLGYHVRVVTDCVGGSTPDAHHAALRSIVYLQRDALVDSTEVLRALRARRPDPVGSRA
jgi:biuret amidohydrolase